VIRTFSSFAGTDDISFLLSKKLPTSPQSLLAGAVLAVSASWSVKSKFIVQTGFETGSALFADNGDRISPCSKSKHEFQHVVVLGLKAHKIQPERPARSDMRNLSSTVSEGATLPQHL
jgi:hypothetical protein